VSGDAHPPGADPTSIDRRTFFVALPAAAGVAAGLAGCQGAEAGRAAAAPRLDSIGIQLYTVRDRLAEDVDGTLGQLAAIGYREVELWGPYTRSPEQMRSRLDAHGLRAVSSHHALADIRGDWARTVEGAVTLGQSLIVVPSIPDPERTAEGLRRVAEDFNRAGAAARAAGLRFGYHNHDWELDPLPEGTRPLDLLLERTDPEVVDWQMDIFWLVNGGGDAAAYLREEAGRVTSVHLKDRTADGRMVDVGDGVIDFAGLLVLADEQGLLHAFVEHDTPEDSIESARRSYRHLASLAG